MSTKPEVILLVSKYCPTCPAASRVWTTLQKKFDLDYKEIDIGAPEGRKLSVQYYLRSVPSTIINGQLAHVGVPSREEAMELLSDLGELNAKPEGKSKWTKSS